MNKDSVRFGLWFSLSFSLQFHEIQSVIQFVIHAEIQWDSVCDSGFDSMRFSLWLRLRFSEIQSVIHPVILETVVMFPPEKKTDLIPAYLSVQVLYAKVPSHLKKICNL